jgi:hypothetical protein
LFPLEKLEIEGISKKYDDIEIPGYGGPWRVHSISDHLVVTHMTIDDDVCKMNGNHGSSNVFFPI